MPVRLVYSPKAYVYTKNSAGVVNDLTDYVTAGEVQRLVNQVSSAEVTLRNPNRIFTKPMDPVFHPMDSITIYLERIKGYPVQTFTGYLDSTPYYQMFPGTVTLQASCTLKRLQYTYFDPSLEYVNQFFAFYGWISDQQGSIYNTDAFGKGTSVSLSKLASGDVSLADGSLGKLLYATLTDIGNWDDSHIYVEEIPTGVDGLAARIATLMQGLLTQEQTAKSQLTTFLDNTLGSSSQGSGAGSGGGSGGTAGPLTGNGNPEKCYNYLQGVVGGVGAAGIVGNMMQEAGASISLHNTQADVSSFGIIQWAPKPDGLSVGADLGTQLAYVVQELKGSYASTAAALIAASSPTDAATIYCNGREHPNPSLANLPARIANAKAVYSQFHTNKTSNSSSTSTSATATNSTADAQAHAGGGTTTQTGSASGNSSNGILPAIGGNTNAVAGTTISGPVSKGDNTTVINAILNAANAIDSKHYPYAWGGGHRQIGVASSGGNDDGGSGPVDIGFDCSGSVSAVMGAAQLMTTPSAAIGFPSCLGSAATTGKDTSNSNSVNIYYCSTHVFMEINGRYWGTTAGGAQADAKGGPGWLSGPAPYATDPTYSVVHIKSATLSSTCKYSLGIQGGSTLDSAGGSSGSTTMTQGSAEAFTAQLSLPSIEDMSIAIMLGGVGNGLMHDQQLLPFIQQLCEASMRSFQSLPNGDFFAFYPDYFGEFDQHPPYWEIDDVEILSGDLYLNDASLITHQYVVGDNTYPSDTGIYNELFSTGVITVYNAFQQGFGIDGESLSGSTGSSVPGNIGVGEATSGAKPGGMANVMSQTEAIAFVQRYGARPVVSNYPQVRSSIYEMFLAYQQFMVAWANQFQSTLSFTFMPEIYPGGKISFPTHGIQMYVQSVTHSWDYTEGFTTDAVLTAPSRMSGVANSDIPENMVQALVDPVRSETGVGAEASTAAAAAAATSANHGDNR
jgi:hypothetical protein